MSRPAFHDVNHLPVAAARPNPAHLTVLSDRHLQFCLAKSLAADYRPVVVIPAAPLLSRQLLQPKFPSQIACPLPSLVVSFSPSGEEKARQAPSDLSVSRV